MKLEEKIRDILVDEENTLSEKEKRELITFIETVEFYSKMRVSRSLVYDETMGVIEYLRRTEKISENVKDNLYETLRQAARIGGNEQ